MQRSFVATSGSAVPVYLTVRLVGGDGGVVSPGNTPMFLPSVAAPVPAEPDASCQPAQFVTDPVPAYCTVAVTELVPPGFVEPPLLFMLLRTTQSEPQPG